MGSAPAQTTTSTPTLDPEMKAALLGNVDTTTQFTSGILDPNRAAPKSFTADFTPDQLASFEQFRGIANNPLTAQQFGGDIFSQLAQFNAPQLQGQNVTGTNVMGQNVTADQLMGQNVTGTNVTSRDVGASGVTGPVAQGFQVAGINPMQAAQIAAVAPRGTAQVGGVGNVEATGFTDANFNAYATPFQSQVVDPVKAYLDQQSGRALQASDQAARAGGAVRGSNQALQRQLTQEGLATAAGAALSPLYQDMFKTSAGLIQSDADRALQAGLANQGTALGLVQTQAGLDESALSQNFGAQNQRSLAQSQLDQQAGLTNNQNSQQQAMQNAANLQQAGLANQDVNLRGQLANQDADLRALLANQQTNLQAGLANQQTGLQAGLANQDNAFRTGANNQQTNLQAGLANQQTNMHGQLANQQTGLQAGLANQQNQYQTGLANQNAAINSAGVRAAGATGMGTAAQNARNSQIQGSSLLNQSGNQQQALDNARLQDILTALGVRMQSVNGGLGSMTGQSTTQTGGGSGIAGVLGGLGGLAGGLGAMGVMI